jgi:hypothetical protein
MSTDKDVLLKALNASVKDLQQGIERHCCLVASIAQEPVDGRDLKPLLELCPSKSRERELKDAIKDAIDTLEESRKAFRSKQLEALRKRLTLTTVLIETE